MPKSKSKGFMGFTQSQTNLKQSTLKPQVALLSEVRRVQRIFAVDTETHGFDVKEQSPVRKPLSLLYYPRASQVIQNFMSLAYEPSSEPLDDSAKKLFLNRELCRTVQLSFEGFSE